MFRRIASYRPSIESLEARQLMAGDVSAALEGSLLRIDGDQMGNQIAITQTAAGDVVVSGQNGTSINGLPSVRFVRPQLNAVEVLMEGGNDIVTLRGLQIANDLFVDLGAGSDRLNAPAGSPITVGANTSVYGSEGDDTIVIAGATLLEDLYVDGGLGILNANLSNLGVGKSLSVIGDEANDLITIQTSTIGLNVSIESKGGSDRVNLADLAAFSFTINTDSNAAVGADQVTMNRVNAVEDIGIFTGAGNDVVRMTDVSSGKMTVSLDEGNDRLVATRLAVATDAVFEGGAGFDILENLGIFAGVKSEFKEFEVIR